MEGKSMLPLPAMQLKTEAAGDCNTYCCVSVYMVMCWGGGWRKFYNVTAAGFLCGRRVWIRHELGEFVGRTGVWAIRDLAHPEESFLLLFLQV